MSTVVTPTHLMNKALHLAGCLQSLEMVIFIKWMANTALTLFCLTGAHDVLCCYDHTHSYYRWQMPLEETVKL